MFSVQFVLRGRSVDVTGLSGMRVRFPVRKFLYVNHLSGYGVLDTAGSFEIVHIKPETSDDAEEHETLRPPRVPPCPDTIPVNPFSDKISKGQTQPAVKTRDNEL